MEFLGKIIRGIASIPLVGGFFVLIVGFLPFIALIPFDINIGVVMIIGGLLTAAWCYLLNAKNIINIVTPVIPIPNWVLGIVLAVGGVYGIVTNAWDDSKNDAERVPQEIIPSKSVPAPVPEKEPEPEPEPEPVSIPKPDPVELDQAHKILQAKNIDLDKKRDEAAEQALMQMEQSLEDLKNLKETLGEEKFQEIMDAQGGSENSINLEEAMLEMQKQIDSLKSQGYGAGSGSSSSE